MKTKYFLFIILVLIGLLVAAGCSRHQLRIPSLPSRGADIYPHEQNKNGLIVAADDYFDPDKSQQTFGINFVEGDILVIEVIVSNRSEDVYKIKSSEVILVKDDKVIYPLLVSEVSSDSGVNEYLNLIELKDMVINPGENKSGFLFFRLPQERKQYHFSLLWPSDYRLRMGATRVDHEKGVENRLIYTIFLRNL